MALTLVHLVVCILTVAVYVNALPLTINETAAIGTVLLSKQCCNNGGMTLESHTKKPWKYFHVTIDQSNHDCYSIVLNQSLDTGEKNNNCWPKESWNAAGHYLCDNNPNPFSRSVILTGIQNRHRPTFCEKPGCNKLESKSVNVSENLAVKSLITSVTVCDEDVFISGDGKPIITVDSTVIDTRQTSDSPVIDIKLNQPLDYEKEKQYNITLNVTDRTNKGINSLVLILNVKDEDDQGPLFSAKVYHCNVTEGTYSKSNKTSCIVKATDQDKGINADIGYTVIDTGTGAVNFTVDSSGQIRIVGKLDRETHASYVLPVKGYQLNRTADRFDFTAVTLTVTDADDNLPVFNPTPASIDIIENTPNSSLVYQFTAIDADVGQNAKFSYQLEDQLGAFHIDGITGQVTVKNSKKMDREKHPAPILIKVYAVPTGKPRSTSPSANITIHLLDVNDNSPKFNETVYDAMIKKNHSLGSVLVTVGAKDSDLGKNGEVQYSIIEQPDKNLFSINPGSGQISLKNNISDNFMDVYNLVVQAEDQAQNSEDRRSTTVLVKVHVQDVNMHAPVITVLNTLNISESADIGTTVAWINVTDRDVADALTVTLSNSRRNGTFHISHSYSSVYEVTVNTKLDREKISSYRLTITCDDSLHRPSETIVITILDDNDNTPVFSQPSTFSISENKNRVSYVGRVQATDADAGKNAAITYKIDSTSKWITNFTINNSNGHIQTKTSLDREALGDQDILFITVLAIDHGVLPLTGTTTVTVKIIDENDNNPVFDNTNVTIPLIELTKPGLIYTVKASDADIGKNGNITYSMGTIQPARNGFHLSPGTGALSTLKPVQYQDSTNGLIVVQIIAKNPVKNSIPVTQTVRIEIQDVNDHLPQFNENSYSFSISETAEPGSSVGRITAFDEDILKENKDIQFVIEGPGDTFRIDRSSGEIILVKNIDVDSATSIKQYNLKVSAANEVSLYNGAGSKSSTKVTVSVTPVNEYEPHFTEDAYTCSVKENYNGTINCTVKATDQDSGQDGQIAYAVVNSLLFSIDRNGQMSLKRSLDYENTTEREFYINVSATDDGNPVKKSSYSVVTIRVSNENDNVPEFAMRYRITVMENINIAPGYVFAQLKAIDRDGDLNSLVYSINPEVPPFMVYRNEFITMDHRFNAFKFDYENQTVYKLNIYVNDSVHVDQRQLTVNVLSMNDYQPVFNKNYSLEIQENSVWNVTIQAIDHDKGGDDGEIHYVLDIPKGNLIPGNITISQKGNLVISNLDRETAGYFTFTALAIDGGKPPLTGVTVIEVTVKGVDDNPPYYLESDKNVSLTVNEATEYVNIFTSRALDNDIGNGSKIEYRLIDGDSSLFSVSKAGQLSIHSLSIDDGRERVIQIEAYNPTNPAHKATQNIKIHVQDINNKAPHFKQDHYYQSVSECTQVGSIQLSVEAMDNDVDPKFNTVTYWLNNYTKFAIDSHTGKIRLNENLDYDPPGNEKTLNFQVYATDLNTLNITSNHTTSTPVTVTVQNCNDNAPVIKPVFKKCFLKEETTGPFSCSITATDVDNLNALNYSIIDNKQNFTITQGSGEIRAPSLDYDAPNAVKEFVLNVSVTDGKFTSFASVQIYLQNTNDNPPAFLNQVNEFNILENVNVSYLGDVTATDVDGDNIDYSMTGNCTGFLKMVKGKLIQMQTFDFEAVQMCSMVVIANDSINVAKCNIKVHILDANDNIPVFKQPIYRMNVTENTKSTTHFLKATDLDSGVNGKITYKLLNGSVMYSNISLSHNGDLVISNLDRETVGYFTFTVLAIDGGNPPRTGATIVEVTVKGVDDNPPYYLKSDEKVSLTVNEATKYDNIFTSMALDKDIGVGSVIQYRLHSGNKSKFKVSPTGQLIILSRSVDDGKEVNIEIEAYNPSGKTHNATQSIIIHVQDINNNFPHFVKKQYDTNLSECAEVGSIVQRVQAKDTDVDPKFNTVTYWLSNHSKFAIDSRSGEIRLKEKLDYDPPGNETVLSFKVYATDLTTLDITGNHTTSKNVKVTVQNCNDNAPVITPVLKMCNLVERTAGPFACSITATDVDKIGFLKFSLVGDTHNFTISKDSGEISAPKLDYDIPNAPKQFGLNVSVTDGNFTSFSTVLINLKNINDKRPVFQKPVYIINIPENVNMTYLEDITATDPDSENISYSMVGNCAAELKIENGHLMQTQPFDFEKVQVCNMVVTANDSSLVAHANITVHILDANDNIPKFNQSIYNISVTENTQSNTIHFKATDLDSGVNGNITYSLLKGSVIQSNISLSPNGSLVISGLDRETIGYFTFTVLAIDGGNPQLTGVTLVEVTVNGVDDNKPYYLESDRKITLTVNELENYTNIFTSTALDKDIGVGSVIQYRLHSGNKSQFKVLPTGQLTILPRSVDDGKEVNIEIEAYNPSGKTQSATQSIIIHVQDINNNLPHFVKKQYDTNLSECAEVGSIVQRVQAKDTDVDPKFNTVTYWLSNHSKFVIDSRSGEIRLKEKLDYDPPGNETVLSFKVYATDMATLDITGNHTTSTNVKVTVQNCNDNAPVITPVLKMCNLVEERTAGPFACSITATDVDKIGSLKFSLVGDTHSFTISSSSGEISAPSLDYDAPNTPKQFVLNVSVTDGNFTSFSTVLIYLKNINDMGPVFKKPVYIINIPENVNMTYLEDITATDPDSENISYSMKGNCAAELKIENGHLMQTKPFDFETVQVCNMIVTANDSSLVAHANLTVHILDANDNIPKFNQSIYNISVTENTQSNTIYFKATDLDSGANGNITYSLLKGSVIQSNISLSPNGSLVISGLDRETIGYFTFTVLAIDGGNPRLTGVTLVEVTVKGVDDNKPYYLESDRKITLTVNELENYTNIFTSMALDKDIGVGSVIQYRLRSGSKSQFKVSPTGQLTILSRSVDDGKEVNIEIGAYNPSGKTQSATQSIIIHVQDINNNIPRFSQTQYYPNVSECAHVGTSVQRVVAKDTDVDPNFNTVTYWLSNPTKFAIDSRTGEIYLKQKLDYDPPGDEKKFSFKVYATDMATLDTTGNHTTSTHVTVTVQNCNDNAPVITPVRKTCDLQEQKAGNFSCHIIATDLDKLGSLIYSIIDDKRIFNISASSGEIRAPSLDYDAPNAVKQFVLNVSVTDGTFTSFSTVMINLKNTNDNVPVFKHVYKFDIPENVNMSYLGDILATDADGDNIVYSMRGNCTNGLKLENDRLIQTQIFDFEAIQVCSMVVTASDSSHVSNTSVTVHILDANDNVPQFTKGSYHESINENATIRTTLMKIQANDMDGSSANNGVTYTIINGNVNDAFRLGSTAGDLIINKQLNASIQQVYTMVVEARDNGDPSLTNTTMVTVNVADVNDNAPWFLYTPYEAQVIENTSDHTLFKIFAEDIDPDTKLKFSVTGTYANYFYIVDEMLHAHTLDAEKLKAKNILVGVAVTDGRHTATTAVNVTIVDVNDNVPYFTNGPFSITLNDTTQAGTKVIDINAADNDYTNSKIMYFLYHGIGYFDIDQESGAITLQKSLDVNLKMFNLSVIVFDSGSPLHSNEANVIVKVVETNIYTPKFVTHGQNKIVKDFDEDKGNQFVNLSAADSDTGNAGTVSYSITSNSGSWPKAFTFNNITGILTLVHAIDYESASPNDYSFEVMAKDHGTFPKSSTVLVIIHIEDVDEPPVLDLPTKIIYKELNAEAGSVISRVTVKDKDSAEKFRNFTYSIISNSNYFQIKDDGVITANKTLSVAGTYNLTVNVTDGGGLWSSSILTVKISNISGFDLNTTIKENQAPPVVLKNLSETTNMANTIFKLDHTESSKNFAILENVTLVSNNTFDREQTPVFALDIKGYEKVTGGLILKAQIQMQVTVQDENDNAPVFNKSKYSLNVHESTNVSAIVGMVTATDADENPKLFYSITPQSSIFGINGTSGQLYLLKSLDYESNKKSYTLTVTCNDTVNVNQTTVIVKVLDDNDCRPMFQNRTYSYSISESHVLGPLKGAVVMATDPDTADQGKLRYSVIPDKQLGIDNTGQLTLKSALDYDTMNPKHVKVTVHVTDTANHTTSVKVVLYVKDSNDNAPKFNKTEYTFHVLEGTTVSGNNFSVEASDQDSGVNADITFSLGGTDHHQFNITTVKNKGYLHIIQPLNRESKLAVHTNGSAVYTVTVQAVDHGNPQQMSTAQVHIYVDDVNDCPPEFNPQNFTASVQEGTALGTKIITVTTTDCDYLPEYKTVVYSLQGANSDVFNITSEGAIVLNKPVSVKKKSTYNLTIHASDGPNNATAILTVTVLDANDHSPSFSRLIYTFNVTENMANVIIGEVLATDDDPGENGNVSYSITSGNDNRSFTITKEKNDSGLIKVVSLLDREKTEEYSLIITASDNAKTGQRQGTCTVMVKVLDQNDNSPKFDTRSGYSGTISEDSKNGTLVEINPPIHASDLDSENYGTQGIVYILSISKPFCINASTGDIHVCGELDREKQSIFSLQVQARDTKGGSGYRQANTSLNITVTDINDEYPTFVNTQYMYSIKENASSGTSVGKVTVIDADINGVQNVRLSIPHGSLDNFYVTYAVNGTKLIGTIYVSGVLDRETVPSYNLTVVADDSLHRKATSVIVQVLDVNDNAPVFNETSMEVKVEENSEPSLLYTITAYDTDQPKTNNSEIMFMFSKETMKDYGHTFGLFKNGSLYTKVKLDRENISSYRLTVIASDKGTPPMNASTSITVIVLDVNDHAPSFCNTPPCVKQSYVVETAPVGSILALPIASDPDKDENGTIAYSILQSPASKYFSINNKTGLVAIGQSIVINTLLAEGVVKQTENTTESVAVNVTVEARDGGGRVSNLTLEVTVEQINDNAPVFENPCNFNITEELPEGTFVGDCFAVIPNGTYSHMTYRLIAGFDSSSFHINDQNGTIRTAAKLDREKASHYSLSVQVTDGRTPERTAFTAVKITVNDINDNVPVFYQSPVNLQIPENSNWSRSINTSAVDRDEGQNGLLTFTIDNSYSDLFVVNNVSGIVTVTEMFDYENCSSYSFHVLATDHGRNPKSSSVLVKIAVIDVNDNVPTFFSVKSRYDIPENHTGKIFTVNATDKDSSYNGKVLFSITENDDGPFIIDPIDGSVYIDGHLDYETRQVYKLTFEATDQGLPPLSSKINVTIQVIDVYDLILQFTKDVYEINVDTNATVGTQILDLNINGVNASYGISGQDSEYFDVSQTGSVFVKAALIVHNRQEVITVTATDGHGQTAQCKVIIYNTGHEVFFPRNLYNVSLPENLNQSSLLLDLNTTEEQTGQEVLYMITGIEPYVEDVFRIMPSTGKVYCDKSLDREIHGEYNIYISAFLSKMTHRHKRQVDESSTTIKLTVHVDDEDDNPPTFGPSQQSRFGVPGDAKANFLVTQLQANDPDLGENGHILYSTTGDTDVFGVDKETGEVKTLVAIASQRDKTSFKLSVTAHDVNGGQGQTLDVQIVVVPPTDRLMLQVNTTLTEFRHRQTYLIGNMSKILGVEVQLELAESHHENTDTGIKLDISKTDMYFHGMNQTTGAVVPFDVMIGLITQAHSDLEKLFGNGKAVEVTQVKVMPLNDPSAITVPVIALLSVAIFIFFGTIIAIILAQYSWTRFKDEKKAQEKQQQHRNLELNDFEMDTLRSHKSCDGSNIAATAAVNPVFMETELGKSPKKKEKKVVYETQEAILDFPAEPFRLSDEILNNDNGTRSVVDSALENTSLNSNDQHKSDSSGRSPGIGQNGKDPGLHSLKVDDGPVMTSSPRISRDIESDTQQAILSQAIVAGGSGTQLKIDNPISTEHDKSDISIEEFNRRDRVLTLTMDSGETETDDGALNDFSNNSMGRSESKSDNRAQNTTEETSTKFITDEGQPKPSSELEVETKSANEILSATPAKIHENTEENAGNNEHKEEGDNVGEEDEVTSF